MFLLHLAFNCSKLFFHRSLPLFKVCSNKKGVKKISFSKNSLTVLTCDAHAFQSVFSSKENTKFLLR